MPLVAPKKSEWIPNESANECMCCKQLVFTMFNRRHHCRRCGRVVCGLCSMNRLKLSAYKDLNVRVCNQCYDQTRIAEGISSDSCTSDDVSSTYSKRDYNQSISENISDENEWILAGDLDRDNAVREEFGFTHAPSVSLCLSILSLYDDSEEAPNFLLSECDAVIRIMKPKIIGVPNNEIDYSLLIEIMRSMAIAAKVKFSHLIQLKTNFTSEMSGTNDAIENKCTSYYYAGISRCDYILNYADLAQLLVEHSCEGLLTQTMEAYDIQILREQLMLSERWTVALEVSLKAGLDKASVFAAWGKTCLRAGAFLTAREKFSHCLKAVHNSSTSSSAQHQEIFTVENFMEEKYSRNVFKYATNYTDNNIQDSVSKVPINARPSKDPILLNEIIEILEKTHTLLMQV
ncbi:zinc finger FYVE domain-containing protein 26 homolog [Ctenocephalides felis]|uniref:zinc finger FYVE domain-containing protein 26 homolog n=1 Tax=Ctenocephalides felis TaxID=7515 RepID=UPI000E6E3BF3|nr:zinc finger FYVE domain-containing protein 26 homolog [Ctenocephalides felis]